MSAKQVIVMRKDLNMRKGKMVAQGAHASMKVMMDKMKKFEASDALPYAIVVDEMRATAELVKNTRLIKFTDEELGWVDGIFTKICVSVNSEQELLDVYAKAKESGLNCALITDSGLTEFGGVPTNTCCAIGPNASEKIDLITGSLQLL